MYNRLLIRADATTLIGTGHIMRCLALAQAWQDKGGHVTFLSHCESELLRQRILNEGFDLIPIDKPHPNPYDLGKTISTLASTTKETNITKPTNQTYSPWLVLDGYHFSSEYQKQIHESGCKLLVIDDNNHQPRYHADILLNQNIHAPGLKYSCNMGTVQLLGTEYVLLRREFLNFRHWKRSIPENANKVLVTLGGGDPDNATLKVIKALNRINDPNLNVKIVAGPSNPNILSLQESLAFLPFKAELLCSVKDMPSLIDWADVAVSAGGSTCWELAFFGVPFLVVILAQNQEKIAFDLQKNHVAQNLGWANAIQLEDITTAMENICANMQKRQKMSSKGRKIIDGRGAKKVALSIKEASI